MAVVVAAQGEVEAWGVEALRVEQDREGRPIGPCHRISQPANRFNKAQVPQMRFRKHWPRCRQTSSWTSWDK